jgi:copper resistance protein C
MQWPVLAGLAMLALTSPAFAHAFLERANPPVGSQIAASPPELTITFTEGIEPLFSTIEVRGASGTIAAGPPHTASGNNRVLSVALPKLPPGTYAVKWHATSVDTHKTEGGYQFTIAH